MKCLALITAILVTCAAHAQSWSLYVTLAVGEPAYLREPLGLSFPRTPLSWASRTGTYPFTWNSYCPFYTYLSGDAPSPGPSWTSPLGGTFFMDGPWTFNVTEPTSGLGTGFVQYFVSWQDETFAKTWIYESMTEASQEYYQITVAQTYNYLFHPKG